MASNSPTPSGNSMRPRKTQPNTGISILLVVAAIAGFVGVLYLISWVVSSVMAALVNDSLSTFGFSATMVILLGVVVIGFILGRGKRRR